MPAKQRHRQILFSNVILIALTLCSLCSGLWLGAIFGYDGPTADRIPPGRRPALFGLVEFLVKLMPQGLMEGGLFLMTMACIAVILVHRRWWVLTGLLASAAPAVSCILLGVNWSCAAFGPEEGCTVDHPADVVFLYLLMLVPSAVVAFILNAFLVTTPIENKQSKQIETP